MEQNKDDCNAAYVNAIRDGTLRAVAAEGSPAHIACQRIEARVGSAARELIQLLHSAGVTATRTDSPKLYDHFELLIPEMQVTKAMSVIEEAGYVRWARFERGALRCYQHLQKSMMFIRDDENTMRVVLRWGKTLQPPRFFRPHLKSLASVDLPVYAWPLYFAIHPLYVLISRALGRRYSPEPRPFLGTTRSLLAPLFKAAGLTQKDVFVDVGCGDGRVAIEAAIHCGCEARGIEYQAEIADLARRRVIESGMTERVSILQGDATKMDISDATVIFIFMPVGILQQLLPGLLQQMQTGTKILTHEISPIPADFEPQPDREIPVIGEDAVTVANIWVA